MPSWSIHLALAKKISDRLNLDKDLFLYGNLIPDVDCNGNISRKQTHYYESDLFFPFCNKARKIDIDLFLKDYKEKLSNHLILGYYSHLLTDNYYNEIAYSKWVTDKNKNPIGIKLKDNTIEYIDVDDKQRIKQKYKHDDFELYGKRLYKNGDVFIPLNTPVIKNNISYLKNNFLTENDVDYRIDYLKNGFASFNKFNGDECYKLFNEQELDEIFSSCMEMLISKLGDIIKKV